MIVILVATQAEVPGKSLARWKRLHDHLLQHRHGRQHGNDKDRDLHDHYRPRYNHALSQQRQLPERRR